MNLPSRKERKALAKKLGLVKKKESFKEMMARIGRAQEFGKMLHMQHLQNIENQKNQKELTQESVDTQDQQELKKIISGQNPEE
jgi:hypothetical protein